MIRVPCECGKTVKVKDEYAGRSFKCPDCGAALTVPEPKPDVEDRLAELETENSRLRGRLRRASATGLAGVAVGLVALGLAGYTAATRPAPTWAEEHGIVAGETVAASEFVLYDPGNSNKQAVLAMGRYGVELQLNDADGNPRITLGMGEKSPEIQILDQQGKRLVDLSARRDYSWLTFYDSAGDGRITLGGSKPDAPYGLTISGQESGSEVYLEMSGSSPLLYMDSDMNYDHAIQVGVRPDQSYFDMYDSAGEVHHFVPLLMGD